MPIEPYPTRHVVEKINDRSVTWGEILDVIQSPEVTYGPDFKGRMTVQKGNLCVVLARDGAVITVLLRSAINWTDEDIQGRNKS